jgi:hypothetical protein
MRLPAQVARQLLATHLREQIRRLHAGTEYAVAELIANVGRLLGVKNCTLIVDHRLFQQHEPGATCVLTGSMKINIFLSCGE